MVFASGSSLEKVLEHPNVPNLLDDSDVYLPISLWPRFQDVLDVYAVVSVDVGEATVQFCTEKPTTVPLITHMATDPALTLSWPGPVQWYTSRVVSRHSGQFPENDESLGDYLKRRPEAVDMNASALVTDRFQVICNFVTPVLYHRLGFTSGILSQPNSTLSAILIAALTGHSPIYLLGYDLYHGEGNFRRAMTMNAKMQNVTDAAVAKSSAPRKMDGFLTCDEFVSYAMATATVLINAAAPPIVNVRPTNESMPALTHSFLTEKGIVRYKKGEDLAYVAEENRTAAIEWLRTQNVEVVHEEEGNIEE